MRTSTLYDAIDLILDGRLADLLDLWHRARVPNPVQARLLYEESGVLVSRETIRKWNLERPQSAA